MRTLIFLPLLVLTACGGSSSPASTPVDTTPPVITLTGDNPQIIEAGEAYTELGATARDNVDGDLTAVIVIDASSVDTSVPGEYPVTYDVSDAAGNAATTVTRTVICQDTTPPAITLTGANPQTLSQGDAYEELGATATDTVDGDLTAAIVIDASEVDISTVGDYTVSYDVSDAARNAAVTITRTVRVLLAVPAEPTVSVAADIKQLIFTWDEIAYAYYYRLLENPDGSSGFTQVGDDIPAGTTSVTTPVAVHLQNWVNAEYVVEACNNAGCNSSAWINAADLMLDTIGYFKASNTDSGDLLGWSIALSADGNTLAAGAVLEDSNATGIDGNQSDDSAIDSGAVYVFRHDGRAWSQEAYIKASNSESGDSFGCSLALSEDGNTLAVGARFESSDATGINGDQASNAAERAGAVYVFRHDGSAWSQQAYVKASNTQVGDQFGAHIALRGDGNRLAVGATGEDSAATGIDGDQGDDLLQSAGAVYVFDYDGGNWFQQAYVKASNAGESDRFATVALSLDGNTLAVGATHEDSGATFIGGDENDNSVFNSGAVYVFRNDGTDWTQQAYVKAPVGDETFARGIQFGFNVALDSDGDTLAVGSPYESSSATGINGNWFDSSADQAGAVYVLQFATTSWGHTAYVKASNTGSGDHFGWSLALSADGSTLAAGAPLEDGNSSGVGGDDNDVSFQSGAAYVFRFDGIDWSQRAYVKASNNGADSFGHSVALSGDGNTLATGATGEDSAAAGIDGDQEDNSVTDAGAVYLY